MRGSGGRAAYGVLRVKLHAKKGYSSKFKFTSSRHFTSDAICCTSVLEPLYVDVVAWIRQRIRAPGPYRFRDLQIRSGDAGAPENVAG